MITDALISLFGGLLTGVLGFLPEWVMPSVLTDEWPGDLATAVAWANGYFPVYDLGLCLGIILGLRVLLAAWRIAVWLYDRFPFKFT